MTGVVEMMIELGELVVDSEVEAATELIGRRMEVDEGTLADTARLELELDATEETTSELELPVW